MIGPGANAKRGTTYINIDTGKPLSAHFPTTSNRTASNVVLASICKMNVLNIIQHWPGVSIIFLFISCFILGKYAHSAFCGTLSSVPNMHWLAPWSRLFNVSLKYFYNIRICHYNAHINGKDGHQPLLRVGPNEVSIMSTEGVRLVWGRGFNRSPWYHVFQNFGFVVFSHHS